MATIWTMVGKGSRRGRRLPALALGVAAAIAASPATASALSPGRAGAAVVDHVARSPASIRAYWTPTRMRSAVPVSLPSVKGARASTPSPRSRRGLADRLTHIKRKPTRTSGKVFFSAGAYNYECSGTVVRAPVRSLVLTAGHCGYFQLAPPLGNAVHNWEFVPSYDGGRKPFGEWPATNLAATPDWVASEPVAPAGELLTGDLRYDVSAATVGKLHGRTIQSAVGGRQITFGRPRNQQYEAIGYPAEAPFSGKSEYFCGSRFQGSDTSLGPPAPISIACNMTGGASGGGWFDRKGRLVSLTSYGYSNEPDTLYGPYFGSAIRTFYNSVKNG